MQVYRGLPILTNQDARRAWSASGRSTDRAPSASTSALAHEAIDEIVAAGRTAVVVGGTGLWFRQHCRRSRLPPARAADARARWERLYDRRGADDAHGLLQAAIPRAAAQVHPNDRKRVVRALELWQAGANAGAGATAPVERRDAPADPRRGPRRPARELAARIRARTAAMFEQGVEDEVRRPRRRHRSPQVLGLEAVAELPRGRGDRGARASGRCASPPTSASGCAASPASLASTPTARRGRWRMRFSRWHALGNSYLLVERRGSADADPSRATALRRPHGIGSTACSRSSRRGARPRS